jgi:hypothetical protein
VPLDHKGHKDHKDHVDHKDHKDHKDQLVPLDQGLLDHKAHAALVDLLAQLA